MNGVALRCVARKKNGEQCKMAPIKGGTVCSKHGGSAPQVKARAAVVAEARAWRLTDITEDPGEVLLRLVTQSAARARLYAAELEALCKESPSLREALVGETWISTEHDTYKAGEYIRGLAKLEAEERDRCAGFAAKAIAAGLAERTVRMAERQTDMIAASLRAVLDRLNLTPEQKALEESIVTEELRRLNGPIDVKATVKA